MKSIFLKNRIWFITLVQVLTILAAFILSFEVRFDFDVPQQYRERGMHLMPALVAIKMPVFWYFGLLKGWWRYVSMPDLVRIAKGNIFASLAFVAYAVLAYRLEQVPRSVLVLDFVFCFVLTGGMRFVIRAVRENYLPMPLAGRRDASQVLVIGAGEAGQAIVREIRSNPTLDMRVIGFIDDDPKKRRELFQGCKVLGPVGQLEAIVKKTGVDEIIIAIPSAKGEQVRAIVESCTQAKVKFKILPGVGDLIHGGVSIQQLRDVNLEDLLGREAIKLDDEKIAHYLMGKRVLVTGAGGSIGSELCRQIVRFKPQKLILFENGETPLFHIENELRKAHPEIPLVAIIGDVRSRVRVEAIFAEQMPEVVFHAAAYKHVPMMECNPAAAVSNNVHGTRIVAETSDATGVKTFVMVSTDKAVRPTNIMGATKRTAELFVQSLSRRSETRFVTTRFGNVLGSNGSVIPTFREQIKQGGPLTVTDPEVTRFFMTIPEASQLVLQAGCMGHGGEIFLFDMGEPVKIVKLAEEMIRLSGYKPYEDIDIVFTGLRPGEKLYEELLLADEGVLPSHHEKICIASSCAPPYEQMIEEVEALAVAAKKLDYDALRKGLQRIVPEYQPAGTKCCDR
ncbi:MAG: nucleoside-diphosphate sugar epimerase/dehydratase [Desulfuromonadales bacterium]|nr:nucleoside-diphosphate sugar epimerase/dehydratase [Desulfuromonadales bacterium]